MLQVVTHFRAMSSTDMGGPRLSALHLYPTKCDSVTAFFAWQPER